MHKQFNPHVQFLRTIQQIGPVMTTYDKGNDRRVWLGTDDELRRLEEKQDKTAAEENFLANITCIFCYNVRKHTEDLWVLPCKHIFHKACIRNWARTDKPNRFEGTREKCPECSTSFDFVPKPVNDKTLLLQGEKRGSDDGGGGAAAAAPPLDPNVTNNRRQRLRRAFSDLDSSSDEDEGGGAAAAAPPERCLRYTGDLVALALTPFPVLYTYGLQVVIMGNNVYRGSQMKGCIADVVDIIQYGEFIKVAVRGFRNYTTTFHKRWFRALPEDDENFMSLADIFRDSSDEDE